MPEKQLKICYLITKSNFGGAQRYVYDLATEAKAAGHEVLVGFGGEGPLKAKLDDGGVRTISINTLERDVRLLGDIKTFFTLLALFHNENPDILHLNSSKMGGLGAAAGRVINTRNHLLRLLGKKNTVMHIVFTGHGWAWNEERGDVERFVIGLFHWLTILLSHETIAVSRRTRDQVAVLPFTWHKLKVIHNGRDPMNPVAKEDALDIIFGDQKSTWLTESPIIIGTIAELHKSKGLSYAILAMAQMKKQKPDTRLLFVIIGEEGQERDSLEKLIVQYELEGSVFIAGRKENAASLLSAFDIFLLPSITEAFPYAVLEAGNAGLPVVATAVGGIPEIIHDMESGILIQSRNPSEIARAILYLVDNPQRMAKLGEVLKERIRDRFSVKHMVTQTFSVYNRE